MELLAIVQGGVALVLVLGAVGMALFALVDALRHPGNAYVAAGKRTKGFWLAIVGVSAGLALLSLPDRLGFLTILGVLGAGVYLADVRPALQQVRGRGGRGSHQGPYGPW